MFLDVPAGFNVLGIQTQLTISFVIGLENHDYLRSSVSHEA